MDTLSFRGKAYRLDDQGFLLDWRDWDEGFPEAAAAHAGISGGLTDRHREVIRHIRTHFRETGECPLVYSTCRALGLRLRDLKSLFPRGYLRGACRLAGLSYRDRFIDFFGSTPVGEKEIPAMGVAAPIPGVVPSPEKVYRVDSWGFLIDPEDWDALYAANKAREMKLPALTERHWRIVAYLRAAFEETGSVPTVIECCLANGLELDEMETLFPDGYHRGAVKLSGLRVRTPGRVHAPAEAAAAGQTEGDGDRG